MLNRNLRAALVLSLCGSAWMSRVQAQQPGDIDPDYAKHDAARLEVPDVYPARAYNAEQLLQRFVELANGPEVTREDLEAEFGLRFVKLFPRDDYLGVARGRHPLGSALSSYTQYGPAGASQVFFMLDLRDRLLRPRDRMPAWTDPKLCVDPVLFEKVLGSGWRRKQTGGGDLFVRVTYERGVSGHTRTVEVVPPATQPGTCITNFSMSYRP